MSLAYEERKLVNFTEGKTYDVLANGSGVSLPVTLRKKNTGTLLVEQIKQLDFLAELKDDIKNGDSVLVIKAKEDQASSVGIVRSDDLNYTQIGPVNPPFNETHKMILDTVMRGTLLGEKLTLYWQLYDEIEPQKAQERLREMTPKASEERLRKAMPEARK